MSLPTPKPPRGHLIFDAYFGPQVSHPGWVGLAKVGELSRIAYQPQGEHLEHVSVAHLTPAARDVVFPVPSRLQLDAAREHWALLATERVVSLDREAVSHPSAAEFADWTPVAVVTTRELYVSNVSYYCHPCERCDGTGIYKYRSNSLHPLSGHFAEETHFSRCYACKGTGRVEGETRLESYSLLPAGTRGVTVRPAGPHEVLTRFANGAHAALPLLHLQLDRPAATALSYKHTHLRMQELSTSLAVGDAQWGYPFGL